jgi:cell division protein FtsW
MNQTSRNNAYGPAGSVRRTSPSGHTAAAAKSAGAFARIDYPLVAIVATLVGFGLVMIYSASYKNWGSQFFLSQLPYALGGAIMMMIMATIDYRLWRKLALPIMAATLVVLLAVLLFGALKHGAKRSLLGVQPSEFSKLSVVIYVSAWVANRRKQVRDVRGGLFPFSVLMAIIASLLLLEPSISVTVIVLVTGFTIFFIGGGDWRQLLTVLAIGAPLLALIMWFSPHGGPRVRDWFTMLTDPNQAIQLSEALRVLRQGVGLAGGASSLIPKETIPLLWSDYLFANIAADLGLIGVLAVMGLFAALGYRTLGIALNAPDQFGSLLTVGVTTWILVQAAIHMGASIDVIPTTGIPLPFMSQGGSHLVASMMAIGVVLNISRWCPEKRISYATFAFGWRNFRTHLPQLRRSRSLPAAGTLRRTTRRTRRR